MSSTDKKKFEIAETSKQAGVDITSDKILLPADSDDHVLVATVPSSANCTAGVNVEVEMSPDGENWCNALVKESSTTEGISIDPIVGNERYSDLTISSPVFNGSARGKKHYDDSGNLVAEDTGTKDFMHNLVGVDKDFNQSMWIKSDIQPSTTYKPILFRHGGHDTFEKTKTAQLTDITSLIDADTYVRAASDASIVYEAEFPFGSNAESLSWQVGLGIAKDPTFNTTSKWVLRNDATVIATIRIGDMVAGNYFEYFFAFGGGSGIKAYINNVVVSTGQNGINAALVPSNAVSDIFQVPAPINIFHDPWDVNAPYTTDQLKRFKINYGAVGRTYDLATNNTGFCTQDIFSLNTTNYIQVELPIDSTGNHNTVLQNLYVLQKPTNIAYTTFERSKRSVTAQGAIDDGDTLLSFWNLGLLENGTIKDNIGGKHLTKQYSGSFSTEGTGLQAVSDAFTNRKRIINGDINNRGRGTVSGMTAGPFRDTNYGGPSLEGNWTFVIKSCGNLTNTSEYLYYHYKDLNNNTVIYHTTNGNGLIVLFRVAGVNYQKNFTSTTGYSAFATTLVLTMEPSVLGVDNPLSKLKLYCLSYDESYDWLTVQDTNVTLTSGYGTTPSAWTPTTDFTFTGGTHYLGTWSTTNSNIYPSAEFHSVAILDTTINTDTEAFNLIKSMIVPGVLDINSLGHPILSLFNYTPSSFDSVNGILTNEGSLGGIVTYPYLADNGVVDYTNQESSLNTTQNLCEPATLPFSSVFLASNSFSISGWVKTPLNATGTLFSDTHTGLTAGLKFEVTSTGTSVSYLSTNPTPLSQSIKAINDGEWHHVLYTYTPSQQEVYIDGLNVAIGNDTLTDADLNGVNGFTLLSDGQNNANAASPASTDPSKVHATLSNWSIHSEALNQYAAKQLYSNGHVRNAMNLPSIDSTKVEGFWQLNDQTTPEEDSSGKQNNLQFKDGLSALLPSKLVDADGATLAEKHVNGNAITLSITKGFDFTSKSWVNDASGETAICLSLNGFEEQAEYFALWKCSQTGLPDGSINVCDGNWHNLILNYRGRNDFSGDNVSEGDIARFSYGTGTEDVTREPYNFNLSIDGYPLSIENDPVGADYIGGLNILTQETINSVLTTVGFPIYNRHLKYDSNNAQEEYRTHGQFSANVYSYLNSSETDPNSFRGSVDETSFHTDNWWANQNGNLVLPKIINQEKSYTMYGRTNALDNRNDGNLYPKGVPYPLLYPQYLKASGDINDMVGTNQFINPIRKGDTQPWDSQVSTGGLEGWWRWGDTDGDCSVDIKDVKDHNANGYARFIQSVNVSDQSNVQSAVGESIYLESVAGQSTPGSNITQTVQVKLQDLAALVGERACAIKNMSSQVLQYLRIKLTGTGSCDIANDKLKVELHYKKRRMK